MVWWHFMSRWKVCIVLCNLFGFFLEWSVLKDTLVDKCLVLSEALLRCCWLHFYTTTSSAGLLHMHEWRLGGLHHFGCPSWKKKGHKREWSVLISFVPQAIGIVPASAFFPHKQLSLLLWNCWYYMQQYHLGYFALNYVHNVELQLQNQSSI